MGDRDGKIHAKSFPVLVVFIQVTPSLNTSPVCCWYSQRRYNGKIHILSLLPRP